MLQRRVLVVVALLLAAGHATAWERQTGNGTTFDVAHADGGVLTRPAELAQWGRLCVRAGGNVGAPCAPADLYTAACPDEDLVPGACLELAGLQLVLPTQVVAGLDVQRKVYAVPAGGAVANGYVRFFDTLTNPTNEPIRVSVGMGGGLLYPDGARVWRTSDNDGTLEETDRWAVVDDDDAPGGAGSVAVLIQGAGAFETADAAGALFAAGPDALGWEFGTVVVPPNTSVSFITFLVYEAAREDAIVEVANLLVSLTRDAVLEGLTEAEVDRVLNFDVEAGSVAPVARAGGPYVGVESQPPALDARASRDPEGGPLTYVWDLDDDGEFDEGQGNLLPWVDGVPERFQDDGTFVVRVRVTDESGKSDVDETRLTLTNDPPQVESVVLSPADGVDEGETLEITTIQFRDLGADTHTFEVDWEDDGIYDEVDLPDPTATHRYFADGDYTVRVRVTDDDGGAGTATVAVRVDNAAPEIVDVFVDSPAREGTEVGVIVTAVDPGRDPLTYEFDLDNDGVYEAGGTDDPESARIFEDDGEYPIGIRVCDAQGACTEDVRVAEIRNAVPEIVDILDSGPVTEGSPLRVEVQIEDPGADTHTYAFEDRAGGGFDAFSPQLSRTLTYDQQGDYRVRVRVRDDDHDPANQVDGEVEGATTVVVLNGPPTATLDGPDVVDEGAPFELRVAASDPGRLDRLTFDFDLDEDEDYEILDLEGAPVVPCESGVCAEIRQEVTLPRDGLYTLHVRVKDGDGGELVLEKSITVRNVQPDLELDFDTPVREGAEVEIRALADDPGEDPLFYSFDLDGDGDFEVEDSPNATLTHVYLDDGLYDIDVVVSDGETRRRTRGTIQVLNVSPTIEVSSDSPVEEGQQWTLTAEVSDPGDDTILLDWDFDGDGEPEIVGQPELERTLDALDDGFRTVRVTARDEDGGSSIAIVELEATNVPPVFLELALVPAATEGTPYELVLPFEDPAGPADPPTFSLIDPPPGVEVEAVSGQIIWTPTFADVGNSPIAITARVEDGDGGADETTIEVEVVAQDDDGDGVPDSYERMTCDGDGACLDPEDPNDAFEDFDGDGRDNLTEWEQGTDPFTYDGPPVPVLAAPDDGVRVSSSRPELVVEGGLESPLEGFEVEVIFEIYGSEDLALPVVTSEPVPQPAESGATWLPPELVLFEDNWYWWRARAQSGPALTDWSAPRSFFVNAENTVPTAPVAVSPEDGAVIDTTTPTLVVRPSEDPDLDELRYVFRIYGSDGTPETSGTVLETDAREDGLIAFEPDTPLFENAELSWDVVCVDEVSAESEASERRTFVINTSNDAPSTPRIVFPAAQATVDTLRPEFRAEGAIDNDHPELLYTFRIVQDGAEVMLSDPIATTDGGAAWTPGTDLVEDSSYSLEVYVEDPLGATSDTVSVDFFVSVADDAPPVPDPISPSDQDLVRDVRVPLVWAVVEDPEGSEVYYQAELCVLETDECQPTVVTPDRTITVGPLVAGGRYRWRVRAADALEGGNWSAWSTDLTFSVEAESSDDSGGCSCSAGAAAGGGPGSTPWWALLLLGLRPLMRRRRAG